MEIVKDPQKVERLAKQGEEENRHFRAWIKGHGPDDDKLNDLIQELTEEVWAEIDCTQCANCCRTTMTCVVPDEFAPLARVLGLSLDELKAQVLKMEDDVGEMGERGWVLPYPCPLLDGNLCRVYDERPQQCRDYPYLHTDFRSHSISRFTNAEICPIVFNVIEALKFELPWPGLRRWRGRSRRRR
jgi:Fe-S-cluster containining protein